jgi:hypothetical protein
MRGLRSGHARWIVLALLAGAAIGAIAIQPAIGGGLFTKKKAKKVFYTKAQSDSRFLTPAAGDGRYLTPASGDGRYLPGAGSIQLQISPDNWFAALDATVHHSTGFVGLSGNAANQFYNEAVSIPAQLQGRPMQINSFVLCYAVGLNAILDRVFLAKTTPVSSDVIPTVTTPIVDNTDRPSGERTCRTYAGASPVPIGPQDQVQIVLGADFSTLDSISVSRTTVNMSD